MEGALGVTARPRLLFLCQTLPYPPDGGVWIRTYHILRLLSRAFEITALCFERTPMDGGDPAHLTATSVVALSRFASVEAFPVPQRHSRTRFVWDHLRSLARRRVYTTFQYDSQDFAARLQTILRSRDIDLVHVDSLDLAGHLAACGDRPVVCVHHDVTSLQLARRADIEGTEWRRAYLRHQARLTEKSEREWCGQVALNVAVSAEDSAALQRIAPGARVAVVPNGVDVDEFRPDGIAGQGAAYVGGLHWFPNADALQYFAAEILPHLRAARPGVPVAWVGSATEEQRRHYADAFGIGVTVPLRAGGGTRLKILNSWAMGKPVVSTTIGCEGLDAVDGRNILIRDNPKEFAAAMLAVLQDEELALRLGRAGRATAEQRYSWDVIGQGLIQRYLDLIHVNSRTAACGAVGAGVPR
jgi:glycosyltransferase involved in cell wall biosynthesis